MRLEIKKLRGGVGSTRHESAEYGLWRGSGTVRSSLPWNHRLDGKAVDGLASGVMRRMQCRAAQ